MLLSNVASHQVNKQRVAVILVPTVHWQEVAVILSVVFKCYDSIQKLFCQVSDDDQKHLRRIKDSTEETEDEFMKMCLLLLHMSNDVALFVQLYRANDYVAVLLGYGFPLIPISSTQPQSHWPSLHPPFLPSPPCHKPYSGATIISKRRSRTRFC